MIVFPAIDLKDGLCVRLVQGDPERATVYGRDPAAAAKRWEDQGASWLHVVDLDGAFSKSPGNLDAVESILRGVSVPVQLGGGIRSEETVERYLSMGVSRVILGTVALREPELVERMCERHPRKIALAVDARDGLVAVEGWKETTGTEASALVRRFESSSLAAIVYTDIQRDGTRDGVNVEATRRLLEATSLPVVASGGVASLEDIERLLPLVSMGLMGVITGRALYAGTLDLGEALEAARR